MSQKRLKRWSIVMENLIRSGFKTPSEAQWSANIRDGSQASDKGSHTHVCCAFSIGLRLALESDLRF